VRRIPSELRELISSKFSTSGQLEVFVLLFRNAERSWSAEEVAEALAIAPQTADMRLFLLSSAALLAPESDAGLRYRYAPSPILDRVARLALEAYDADPEALTELIEGRSPSDPARQLADAFKLRKP
jgi:hypothetical protein